MTETNGTKYINAIAELYQIDDKDRSKMDGAYDKINTALSRYNWPDVERAINYYWVHKSDKTRPTISQILSILNLWTAEGKIQAYEYETEPAGPKTFARPTTNLWSIRDAFDKMIQVLIDGGVIPDENGKLENRRTIIDPATDLPVLNPRVWLGWKLMDAEQEHPDLFVRYPKTSQLERLAIALQNKLIPIKVRDWERFATDSKGSAIVRRDVNITFGTMGA